jgi:hypothetical protein
MDVPESKEGTVFVGEDFDEEMFMWPGAFSAHWESPDGKQFREGPQGVSAQEAIEWGRERADVVYIRPGDSDVYYSAGLRHPDSGEDDETPIWPDGTVVSRRREEGREYLDRTPNDSPIDWQIQLSYDLPAGDVPRFAERFQAALDADPAAKAVNSSVRPGEHGGCAEFEFAVEARTQDQAHELAEAIDERASTAAWPALGKMPAGYLWSSIDHVRPVDADPIG